MNNECDEFARIELRGIDHEFEFNVKFAVKKCFKGEHVNRVVSAAVQVLGDEPLSEATSVGRVNRNGSKSHPAVSDGGEVVDSFSRAN